MFSPNQTGNINEGTLKVLIGGFKDYSGRNVLSSKKKYSSVMRLLPNQDVVAKTAVRRCGKSSDLYEILMFANVNRKELVNNRVLEITIVSSEGEEEIALGSVRLGPPHIPESLQGVHSIVVDESTHWTEMLQKPGVMIRNFHELRPSNNSDLPAVAEVNREYGIFLQLVGFCNKLPAFAFGFR